MHSIYYEIGMRIGEITKIFILGSFALVVWKSLKAKRVFE